MENCIDYLNSGFVKLQSISSLHIEAKNDTLTQYEHSIVTAARVCTNTTPSDEASDAKLIEKLLKWGHLSPFEHVSFTFHVKCPIFIARQLMRHRIASYNEKSGRYTEFSTDYYLPRSVRVPEESNRKKSVKTTDMKLDQAGLVAMNEVMNECFKTYRKLLKMGVAKEQARMVLPLSTYTEFIWTINLRSLMNFISLRASSHAQPEMVILASIVALFFRETCPISYKHFIKYVYTGDILKEDTELPLFDI